ncbi:helix-turn-helix domain-containing protein [Burkholderia sp. Bp8963]|nr:helix-turn-helix domain-containing protein [Burkholderia sp. Bp8963]
MGQTSLDYSEDGVVAGAGKKGRRETRDIGVVVFDGFSLLAAGVVTEVFEMANEIYAPRSNGRPLYDVRFYSSEGGSVAWSLAISVWTYACDAGSARAFDALFVAGGEGARRAARDTRVIDWLRTVVPQTGIVQTIGEGRMLLDAARAKRSVGGAIDATPGADDRVAPARAALALVERDLGSEAARGIAARLALNGEAEPIEHLPDTRRTTAAERARATARWLQQNCERAISVSDAVRVAAMSERNFLRCFKQEIGTTPSEFLREVRLVRTMQLLTGTDLPIGTIARRCGWGNGDRLAKIFRKRMNATPSEYRMRARAHATEEEES